VHAQQTLTYPNSFYADTRIIQTACFNHDIIFVVLGSYFAACAVLCNYIIIQVVAAAHSLK